MFKLPVLVCCLSVAAASPGFLAEVSPSDSAICDDVQQYSGYFKLTTGA